MSFGTGHTCPRERPKEEHGEHEGTLLLLIVLTAVGNGYNLSVWSKSAMTGWIEVVRGTR